MPPLCQHAVPRRPAAHLLDGKVGEGEGWKLAGSMGLGAWADLLAGMQHAIHPHTPTLVAATAGRHHAAANALQDVD